MVKQTKKPATKPVKKNTKPNITVNEKLMTVTIKFKNDKKGGHNHIIVDNVGDNHVSVGLTTKPKKGKNSTNYKLALSPFPDGKTSYIHRQGTVAPKKSYTSPRKGKMTSKDLKRAKEYGARAKQKHLAKNSKKK